MTINQDKDRKKEEIAIVVFKYNSKREKRSYPNQFKVSRNNGKPTAALFHEAVSFRWLRNCRPFFAKARQ